MSDDTIERDVFATLVMAGYDRDRACADAHALRAGDREAPTRIAAACLGVAMVTPECLVDVYDGLADGWLGRPPDGPPVGGDPVVGEVSADLWNAIWAIVEDPDVGRDPADITVRTAALADLLPVTFHDRVAAMALQYPGTPEAAADGIPPRFVLADLACCPPDSLGGHLHSLVVDKGFDLEVLDRDALGLTALPPPLDYLNVRILQCHDIWHLVGGYETSGLHEVAISGFQMAQFGHHYSSMFLGIVLTKAALTQPFEAMGFILDTILSAYSHGRQSPPLLGVRWESIWDRPVTEIRAILGVSAYDSPYPAGLLEELRSA